MIGARTRDGRRGAGGFTLLEVMISLAILVVGVIGLLGRVAGNIQVTQELTLRGVAVDLARGKMYDIEEKLLADGFQDLDQSEDGDFGDEGYPNIEWEAAVEKVEMPGLGALQALESGAAAAEDGALGEGEEGGLASSPLAGFLGGFGGGDGGVGASFIASQFELVTKVLEASIRKVTLTLTWKVGRDEEKMVVVCYLTDPSAMSKVIQTGGADEGEDEGSSASPGGQSGGGASGTRGGRRGGSTRATGGRGPGR